MRKRDDPTILVSAFTISGNAATSQIRFLTTASISVCQFANRDSRTMQCNLSNLSSPLVNIFYFTNLSIYKVRSNESNVTLYTQLYKLDYVTLQKLHWSFKRNVLPLFVATPYESEFRIWSTNVQLINLTKNAQLGVGGGALKKYNFEYSRHDLPCISSWNQTNFKSISVTFLCQSLSSPRMQFLQQYALATAGKRVRPVTYTYWVI